MTTEQFRIKGRLKNFTDSTITIVGQDSAIVAYTSILKIRRLAQGKGAQVSGTVVQVLAYSWGTLMMLLAVDDFFETVPTALFGIVTTTPVALLGHRIKGKSYRFRDGSRWTLYVYPSLKAVTPPSNL